MHDELSSWRNHIIALMLFGALFYALIPLFGMAAHRFLPPHEHSTMGGMQVPEHDDTGHEASILSFANCFAFALTSSGEQLVHSTTSFGAVFSIAPAIGPDNSSAFWLVRHVIARTLLGSPPLKSVFLLPEDPPPNRFTVS
jgi:hypothetical protein